MATKGSNIQSKVLFIKGNSLDEVVARYQKTCSILDKESDNEVLLHFYLSFENKTFEEIANKYGLVPLQVEHAEYRTAFDEAIQLICNLAGLTKRQISEKYCLEPIEVRKMGIKLLNAVSSHEVVDKEGLIKFMQEKLGLQITKEYDLEGRNLLRSLLLIMQNDQNISAHNQYSSIHKAKGLEADTVLVVARNIKELLNWLTIDKDARANDNNDSCRIGFVAFTRAKTMLCIACLKALDKSTEQVLAERGVSLLAS